MMAVQGLECTLLWSKREGCQPQGRPRLPKLSAKKVTASLMSPGPPMTLCPGDSLRP